MLMERGWKSGYAKKKEVSGIGAEIKVKFYNLSWDFYSNWNRPKGEDWMYYVRCTGEKKMKKRFATMKN